MKALDLVEQVPLVTWETDALSAVQILAEHRLSGLVVADPDGVPAAVVPGPQLLRVVVPQYVLDDPNLAHVYDEAGAGEQFGSMREHRLGELRDAEQLTTRRVVTVLPEDTVIEIAAAMWEESTPLVLVRGRGGEYHGVVTLARLAAALLEYGGAGTDGTGRTLEDGAVGDGPQ
ncbi:CBS domain-containing protein [Spongisporangium articulatum]|uniref:CBS domain-containing protein n=1 Tax=Spongisporangium articulatum TaxID=3362603 RepID=A0ABW8AIU8_9ACTN